MEFVDSEAPVSSNNEVGSDNEAGSEDEVSDINSLKSFIDDNMEIEEVRTYYCNFENVTKSADETLAEEFYESIHEIENFDEVSNFCNSSEEEGLSDEFKDVEKRIEKFEETLHSNGEEKQSILLSTLYHLHWGLMFLIKSMFAQKMNYKRQ